MFDAATKNMSRIFFHFISFIVSAWSNQIQLKWINQIWTYNKSKYNIHVYNGQRKLVHNEVVAMQEGSQDKQNYA